MPVGVPDFWPGQLIHYEGIPTDGRLDASPTSNWAYDHEHLAQHATFATSASDVALYSRPIYTRMLSVDAYHMVLADWIMDGAWHDWVVPFGGITDMEGVVIRLVGQAGTDGASLYLKGNGPVGAVNRVSFWCPGSGESRCQDFIIGVDETGIVRYQTFPGLWLQLNALMTGFFR